MKPLQMVYVNDDLKAISVRILDLRYDSFNGTGDIYVTLQPTEMQLFEVHAPAGHVLYVKKWPELVMISHIDPVLLLQLEGVQPPQGGA